MQAYNLLVHWYIKAPSPHLVHYSTSCSSGIRRHSNSAQSQKTLRSLSATATHKAYTTMTTSRTKSLAVVLLALVAFAAVASARDLPVSEGELIYEYILFTEQLIASLRAHLRTIPSMQSNVCLCISHQIEASRWRPWLQLRDSLAIVQLPPSVFLCYRHRWRAVQARS